MGISDEITRRQALRRAGAAGLALGAFSGIEDLVGAAADAAHRPAHASLRDIEHVVILIQENRSFDHYFGTLAGVRGFGDRHHHGNFFQRGEDGRVLHPFHLQSNCITDITHDWAPQHRAWNGGRMNHFLLAHQQAETGTKPLEKSGAAPETMGYLTRRDLPFYYALADRFTICDGYHCSVIGPTDPNRLYSMSATIDPDGRHGGPLLETLVATRGDLAGHFTWPTMPERLQAHGISWKQYTAGGGGILDSVLPFFAAFSRKGTPLYDRGVAATYPDDFIADLDANRLPQVSWLLTSLIGSEHPGYSNPPLGEHDAAQVVQALVSRPEIWRKTALLITWDENGGFFDHVPPPVPRRNTRGEYLTVRDLPAAAGGIRGPIGLGFRVPMLVISPFSRGGLVCSQTFDHTSTLRFLETRFRVKVPNLSAWRRRVTGDLTHAFNFAARANATRPRLPSAAAPPDCQYANATVTQGAFPRQERGRRRRPSGIVR